MKHLVRNVALGTIAVLLPLSAAACGSDSKDDKAASSSMSDKSSSDMKSGEMKDDMKDEMKSDEKSDEMKDDMKSDEMKSDEMTDDMKGQMAEPFGPACSSVPTEGAGSFDGMAKDSVATAASNNPALSTLVQAVMEADLVDTLNNANDITVFAPTNDAFAAVPKSTMMAALDDPKGLLTDVLQNHVVAGRLTPEELAGEHETLGGGMITVEGSGEMFTVEGTAKVVCGNVQTANATVYIIDSVLMPK